MYTYSNIKNVQLILSCKLVERILGSLCLNLRSWDRSKSMQCVFCCHGQIPRHYSSRGAGWLLHDEVHNWPPIPSKGGRKQKVREF